MNEEEESDLGVIEIKHGDSDLERLLDEADEVDGRVTGIGGGIDVVKDGRGTFINAAVGGGTLIGGGTLVGGGTIAIVGGKTLGGGTLIGGVSDVFVLGRA